MTEHHADRVHPETVVLDIGGEIGALVIYTAPTLHGIEIEVCRRASGAAPTHVQVLERRIRGQPVYAAVYPGLHAGDYDIWATPKSPPGEVTIVGGAVASVDWR